MPKEIEVTISVSMPVAVRLTIEVSDDFDCADPSPDEYRIIHAQDAPGAMVSSVREVEEAMRDEDLEELDRLLVAAIKKGKKRSR